jgi:hypothetical protein
MFSLLSCSRASDLTQVLFNSGNAERSAALPKLAYWWRMELAMTGFERLMSDS